MADSLSTSNSERRSFAPEAWGNHAPVAALCAALLVICFELFINVNGARFEDAIEANLHNKARQIRNDIYYDDIAIFGDSKFFSVQPSVVREIFSTRPEFICKGCAQTMVSNYAWPFMGIEAYDAMLAATLTGPRERHPPKVILLNARPELVGMPESANAMAAADTHRVRAYEAFPLGELIRAVIADKNWFMLWDRIAYAMQPPSATHKNPVWDAMRSLAQGHGWPPPSEDYVRMTSDFNSTGAFLMHRKREVTEAEVVSLEKQYGPYGVYHSERLIQSFDRFLTHAADVGTTVLMLGIPLPPPLHERFEKVGAYAGYRKLTKQLEQRHPNFHVLEPLFFTYPIENFGDAGHLNQKGNALFQKDYASTLRSYLTQLTTNPRPLSDSPH